MIIYEFSISTSSRTYYFCASESGLMMLYRVMVVSIITPVPKPKKWPPRNLGRSVR